MWNSRDSMLPDEIRQIIENLCGDLAALGPKQDDAEQLADVLIGSGATSLLVPTAAGGLGGSWADLMNAATQVGRVSGSAAWLMAEYAFNAALVGGMGESVQQEVWGTSLPRVALALNGETSVLESSDEGVTVSGRWKFVPGALRAEWTLLAISGAKAHELIACVPRAALGSIPIEHLGGLRGVGFGDLEANNLAVPSRRLISRAQLFASPPVGVDINTKTADSIQSYWLNAQLGSVLGCAQGGYEEYREITSRWVGSIAGNKVAELTQVQSRLGQTYCELKTVALLVDDMVNGATSANDHGYIAGQRSYLGRLCFDAVARLVQQMGARGLFDQNPVQRRYRDLRAMVAHDAFDWRRNMAGLGRAELGIGDD